MIRKFIFLMLSVTLVSVFNLYSKENKKEEWKNRKFSIEELKKYNGKDGIPVYVAVDGIVYDVTKSKYWKTGKHKNLHDAGNDLTYEIKNQAPKFHKKGKILEKFLKVGVLEVSTETIKAESIEKSTYTLKETQNQNK